MSGGSKKRDPIPVRFEPEEDRVIQDLKKRTGLSRSEIVRRAVRLVRLRLEENGNANFIFELLRRPKRG